MDTSDLTSGVNLVRMSVVSFDTTMFEFTLDNISMTQKNGPESVESLPIV